MTSPLEGDDFLEARIAARDPKMDAVLEDQRLDEGLARLAAQKLAERASIFPRVSNSNSGTSEAEIDLLVRPDQLFS